MDDLQTIDSIVNAADPTLLSLSISIQAKIESYLGRIKVTLPKSDLITLSGNISDVLLGTLPIKDAAGKIIDEIVEYELVAPMLEGLFHEVFFDTLSKLKQYSVNGDPTSILFIDKMATEMMQSGAFLTHDNQKKTTAQILSGIHDEPIRDMPVDKSQILHEIENPQSTVPTPAFVLPNTKPKTADVLKGLSASPIASGSIPATMPTSFPPELDLNLDTAGIVDPIKATPQDNASTAPYASLLQMPSPQPGIGIQMDSKLTSVTGTATKESFKVMPLSETMKSLAENQNAKVPGTATIGVQRTDPYREPIE